MVKCCMTCKYFDYIRVKCEKRKDNKLIPADAPLPCPKWRDWEEKEEKNNGQTRGR